MSQHFYAMLARMKYIDRWALMRNTRKENLCEHSYEVAVLAHALAVIDNTYCGGSADAGKCALLGLYHDAPEIMTGDMPTPVKYYNPAIREAYKQVESVAEEKLLRMLPPAMRTAYEPLLMPGADDRDEREKKLVKAADKLSALIKCVEEGKEGNREFSRARVQTEKAIRAMDLPAANYFLEHFLPSYELTLDEQD